MERDLRRARAPEDARPETANLSESYADILAKLVTLEDNVSRDLKNMHAVLLEIQNSNANLHALQAKYIEIEAKNNANFALSEFRKSELDILYRSTSWRVTAPMRAFRRLLGRASGGVRRGGGQSVGSGKPKPLIPPPVNGQLGLRHLISSGGVSASPPVLLRAQNIIESQVRIPIQDDRGAVR